MSNNRRIVKIFLASPGDLGDERQVAFRIVEEINRNHADFWGCQVELVGWEDTLSRFGRPQELINIELDQCEYFIGMIWKRWGTPPDQDGVYTSGFEEELKRSIARRDSSGEPEISLLLKTISPDILSDPGEDVKRVLKFKEYIIKEKKILFEKFDDIPQFEVKVRRLIVSYIQRLVKNIPSDNFAPRDNKPLEEPSAPESIQKTSDISLLIDREDAKFLEKLLKKPDSWDDLLPIEVAILRLIGMSVSRPGNDDNTIGVHDSNIIFQEKSSVKISNKCLRGLVDSGLQYYNSHNTPLWYWLKISPRGTDKTLLLHSLFGTLKQKLGALSALINSDSAISDIDENIKRHEVIEFWLLNDNSSFRSKAFECIGKLGDKNDVRRLEEFLSSDEYSIKRGASLAIIDIALRFDKDEAIQRLNELQPDSINLETIAQIFTNPLGIKTSNLLSCLSHRYDVVRLKAMQILRDRSQLGIEVSKQLTTDTNPEIRYLALRNLIDLGELISDDDAEKILIKSKPIRGLGSISVLPSFQDREGKEYFDEFIDFRMRQLSESELLSLIDKSHSGIDRRSTIVLYSKFYKKYREDIIRNLDDLFKSEFEESMNSIIERIGPESAMVKDIISMEESYRSRLSRSVVEIVCENLDHSLINLVRKSLDSGTIRYSKKITEYLKKFGSWEDIDRILKTASRPDYSINKSTLLSNSSNEHYNDVAKAIYSIGKKNIVDILDMEIDSEIMAKIIIEIPVSSFSSLEIGSVIRILRQKNEKLREICSLKSICSFSKGKINEILAEYAESGEFRYYNVVHWLDFGISLPIRQARLSAARLLQESE